MSNTCTFIIEKFNMNFSKKYCDKMQSEIEKAHLEGSGVGEVSLFLDSVSKAGRVKSDLKLIY